MTAGALALRELGFIKDFYWAQNVDEVVRIVNPEQPVVVGTSWLEGMLVENRVKRLARATGRDWGGHCWAINGVNTKTELFRGKNSHGDGLLSIPIEDMDKLMRNQGEVCILRLTT